MKSMALDKQMELFDEGGLMQEGGSVDEESGNNVPVGSLKEEVRDDITAQLSEGEFVMPADVVRFHGLDKMMALRDEAKMGLQRMDDMGQMGNSEEAVIPEGIPFGMDDLELEDEPVEMQVGGFIQPQTGMQYTTPSTMVNYAQMPTPTFQPQQPVYGQGVAGGYQPTFMGGTGQPQPTYEVPTFDSLMPKYVTYINPQTKAEIQVPVDASGNPLIPIPAGFEPKKDVPSATQPTPPPTTPAVAPVTQQGRDDPSDDQDPNPAGLTRGQSQVAALTQLDPSFAGTIEGINKKYPDPGIGGLLSPISTIINSFKKNNEISQAVKGYDYDALAKDRGLSTEDLKGTLNTFGQEIYTGYRDAETGTVSGQKDMRSLGQIASEFMDPKTYDDIDEFGNIADDGTMPTTTGVETARVTKDAAGKTVRQTAEEFRADEARKAGLIGADKSQDSSFLDGIVSERVIQTANALMARDKTLTSDDAMRMAVIGETQGIDAVREYQTSPKSDGIVDAAFAGSTLGRATKPPEGVAAAISRSQQTKQSKPKPDLMADDPAGIADSGPVVNRVDPGLSAAVKAQRNKDINRQTKNYTNKGYSSSNAKSAAKNKVAADAAAKRQAQERGDPPDRVNKTSAVTDSKGNAVTSTNAQGKKTIVTSAPREEKDDSGGRWCCSQMVHHGVWTHQGEFARLTVWSMKQPNWWRSGYDVWGKVLAKTFLRKQGFWSGIMQSFFDYHIRNKPYTWRTALAHVMVYPGVFICGHIWTKVPETVRLAKFEELNN
jgi:hypothetical protein